MPDAEVIRAWTHTLISTSALIDALHEVSDPRYSKYGAHLPKEQVAKLVSPHPDTLELVNSWLERHGLPPSYISTTHGGSRLTFTSVPVSHANELIGASRRTSSAGIAGRTIYANDAIFTVVRVNGGGFIPGQYNDTRPVLTQYKSQVIVRRKCATFGDLPKMITSRLVCIDEKGLLLEYATAVCDLFLQLGTCGVGVIFASGEDGTSRASGPCMPVANNGSKKLAPCSLHLNAVVPTFIQHFGSQYKGFYNRADQSVDIPAQALGFVFVENNNLKVFLVNLRGASIISLLNDCRLSKGKSTLGFLKPWLYHDGLEGLTDTTFSPNLRFDTDGFSPSLRVSCHVVSGPGTPDFWSSFWYQYTCQYTPTNE
ncbi:hypothetical protein H4582DRAFT_2130122 [Lactarius indigo]|nr:hypothetical protein H4582DRAFT_2130122 [Lactarius indigo]